ncbi:flagellar filament capping protein FliD [Pseudohalioglobus lutimaris]|uniref:Flagellar hook-associated protein 2 n=1 Tax=Pseudohalioglobus lutimaris TaxID=1737061 RepID=A0A2N5X1B5_9GAMM|nr:flagellar filament capping protein FliD [Pseudohalioglobus lutimaris]PLW68287.1 flagellar hook protein [Pseudohalioglobus lutimaris]
MIRAAGVGSGLDIEGLVTQLVAAERAPVENRLARQEVSLTQELSAFGQFKGALSAFQGSVKDLSELASFGSRTAFSSNPDAIDVSADASAIASNYDLEVSQLARAHSLASGAYGSPAEEVGTGTLTLRFGSTDYQPPEPGPESYNSFTPNPERGAVSITIDNTNNTLEGVRDALNEAGVSASIVNDGSGYRLLINAESTGVENSIEISVSDLGDGNDLDGAGLSAFAFSAGATNLEQTVAAQDALFTVNGLAISSATNTASEVIEGLEFTFNGLTDENSPVQIGIERDTESVKELIDGFITGFNSFVSTVNSLTGYNAATGVGGPLQGDFSARSAVGQIRQVLTNAVAGFDGPFTSLSEIGITTQSDGSLALDGERMDEVLASNFDDLVGLFAAVGFPSDAGVEYVASSDATAVGSYAVDIARLASRGQFTGTAIGFPLTIDANNDSFSVLIDGITSGDLALTQGSYDSGEALAAEIQSRINGDSALAAESLSVSVSVVGNQLQITSDRYGSASRVDITALDTNSAATLGLSIGAGIPGVDIGGTIGGVAALGSGQILRGGVGSPVEGLQLQVESGDLGPRGTVAFSQGIGYQLFALIDTMLDADGALDSRTDGLQGRVEDIEDQREVLDRRMEALEARYRSQFTALDTLLSQFQVTSDFLTQQLAALPKAGSLNNSN